jgi:hypothetical protein
MSTITTVSVMSSLINSVAFSSQANYTDLVTTTGWRILVPTFAARAVLHVSTAEPPRSLISVF